METNYLMVFDYNCEGRLIIIRLTDEEKELMNSFEDESSFVYEVMGEKYNFSSDSANYMMTEKLFIEEINSNFFNHGNNLG